MPAISYTWIRNKVAELAKFGSVGAVAFVVDVGLFNLLRALFDLSPLLAKVISVTVATVIAWLGNRYWTFSDQRTSARGKELLVYGVINVIGLLIGVGALWVSHYALGFTSIFADNVANLIGIGLGTIFRYFGYQRWVFVGDAGKPKEIDS